jgi:anaerobic magnesium-protoporphyrin IX monomethyl ester cyclase
VNRKAHARHASLGLARRSFLEALIAENVDLILVGSTRAADIVRDADILHLYKKAGWQRFLLGLENTDQATLELIRKGGRAETDREAIRLMRRHGILSMATWVVGFEEETDKDHWLGLKRLLSYDPDQIQMLYVTPHRWTPYFRIVADRRVIQTDRRKWDYKHQVLATRHMPPWRTLLWFKFTEVALQARRKPCSAPISTRIAASATPCAGTRRWGAGSGRMRFSASSVIP